jgi:hypothetical protein
MQALNLTVLMAASEKIIALTGGDVRVRRVSRTEFHSLMPPRPEPFEAWERAVDQELAEKELAEGALTKEVHAIRRADLLVQRELAWLETLSSAERVSRREEHLEAMYRIVARATLEPVLTVELVKRLGDDAFTILAGLQAFWLVDDVAQQNGTLQPAVAPAA